MIEIVKRTIEDKEEWFCVFCGKEANTKFHSRAICDGCFANLSDMVINLEMVAKWGEIQKKVYQALQDAVK